MTMASLRSNAAVVVVGGGLAGMCAAVRAAELGAEVTVLEAGRESGYACNSRIAMGFINVAFHDIGQPRHRLRAAIDAATKGSADPALADVLADCAAPALTWLRGLGARTIVGNWRPGSAALLAPPAAIGPGLTWQGRGPDRTLRLLEQRLNQHGGRVLRGVRGRQLECMDGTCLAIEAEQDGTTRRFPASAVVIADGGFAGDPTLLGSHVARSGGLLQRNAGTARGDGLRMAQAVGAALTPLDGFYGHVQCADAVSNRRLWPYPTCDHLCGAGIAVDASGRRFADEGKGGIYLANRIAKLERPEGTFAVFDHRAWMTRGTAFPLPANPLLANAGGTIHSADTILALAMRAGLPPETLAQTVDSYNAALADGRGELLVPARSGQMLAPMPIAEAPFHAVPLIAGITYTTGGIAIDRFTRVRDQAGGTIGGLYAAGSTTGGHEGGPAAGYTGGLSKALVFGKLAGETAVADFKDAATAIGDVARYA